MTTSGRGETEPERNEAVVEATERGPRGTGGGTIEVVGHVVTPVVDHPPDVPGRDDPSSAFSRDLGRLDRRELASFVADLWDAQGWETRVEDDDGVRVVCTDERTGATRVLAPRVTRPRGRAAALVDRLRSASGAPTETHHEPETSAGADGDPTPTEVGPRDLYDRTLYGIDRETAAELCQRHLGTDVEAYTGRGPGRRRPTGRDAHGEGSSGRPSHASTVTDRQAGPAGSTLTVLSVLAILLLAVAAGGGLAPVFTGVGSALTGGGIDEAASGTATPGATDAGSNAASTDVDSAGGAFADLESETDTTDPGQAREGAAVLAPGLTRDGIASPEALAGAHATQVNGRSYVWNVTYAERRGGDVTSTRTVHRVRNATVFRVDVASEGFLVTDPGRLVPPRAYGDGSARYVFARGRIYERPTESADHYAGHAEAVLTRLLRANESEVVGEVDGPGVFLYRVSLSASPDPDRRDYWARMLVTPDGVVHRFEAAWFDPQENAAVSVRLEYDFATRPNVTRPGWAWPANDTGKERFTRTVTEPDPVRVVG